MTRGSFGSQAWRFVRMVFSAAICISALPFNTAIAASPRSPFKQTNLVSNQANKASHKDTDLVNPWGVAVGTDGFFWVSDNGSGRSTLYDGRGNKSGLIVTLPNSTGPDLSKPTGQVLNTDTSKFLGDTFIFASEEGTISGWPGGFAGFVRSDQSSGGAVYKGLALANTTGGSFLFAADFHNGRIDVFDSGYNLVPAQTPSRFVDPNTPAGYAPFNIHLVGKQLYVAYALQDGTQHDDVAGVGDGLISIFTTDGTFVKRFVTGSNAGGKANQLNSPWGIATAPKGFGNFDGNILVGNFGSGRIAAFNKKGKFIAFLSNKKNKPIQIDGLWEIFFGAHGVGSPKRLYFTAGPDEESNGLLGYLAVTAAAKASSDHPAAHPTSIPRPTSTPGYYYPY